MDQHDDAAAVAIADAQSVVETLHAKCCDPGRSPRMEELTKTILAARSALGSGDKESLDRLLESAGAQLGALQIACCAPGRMELYVDALDRLAVARRAAGTQMH